MTYSSLNAQFNLNDYLNSNEYKEDLYTSGSERILSDSINELLAEFQSAFEMSGNFQISAEEKENVDKYLSAVSCGSSYRTAEDFIEKYSR